MYLKREINKAIPIALRLTLWYAGIFTVSSLIAFSIFYFSITEIIHGRTDADLVEDIEELTILFDEGGPDELNREFNKDIDTDGADKVFFRLTGADTNVVLSTDLSAWPNLPPVDSVHGPTAEKNKFSLKTISIQGHPYPARIITAFISKDNVLQIGESLEDDIEFLLAFRNIFIVTVPLVMIIACFFGWFMARKALQGVREVTAAAIDITKGNLYRRVPETGRGDEIDILANTFNTMLDRIQTLITSIHEMTDNIAHDLRSPLARIRGIAETTLLGNPGINDFKSVSGNTIEECDRLLQMINTMMDITESEAGVVKRAMTTVDISNIVSDACELFQPLAEDKNIRLACCIREHIIVYGSIQHLQRMLGNVLDNAMKYTDKGGSITVDLYQKDKHVIIDIADTGIGITEKDLPNIFKRFYRCDQSRSQPGTGLGLSLAEAIAHAHEGDITIISTLQQGSTLTVSIPIFRPDRNNNPSIRCQGCS